MSINVRYILVGIILLAFFYWWGRPTPKLPDSARPPGTSISESQDVRSSKSDVPLGSKKDIALPPAALPSAISESALSTEILTVVPERDPMQSDYTSEQFRANFRKKGIGTTSDVVFY